MKLNDRRHVEEILCVVEEQDSLQDAPRDSIILESWQRCMRRYQLDPTAMREANILPQQRLREHQEQLEDFLHTAQWNVHIESKNLWLVTGNLWLTGNSAAINFKQVSFLYLHERFYVLKTECIVQGHEAQTFAYQ